MFYYIYVGLNYNAWIITTVYLLTAIRSVDSIIFIYPRPISFNARQMKVLWAKLGSIKDFFISKEKTMDE